MTVTSINEDQLRALEELYAGRIETMLTSPQSLATVIEGADLLIGAVLVAGRRAPKVVTRDMVRSMGPGAVVVDVAVDQGGCVETTRPTDHRQPVYVEEGVVHYAVPNMPGSVPRTSVARAHGADAALHPADRRRGLRGGDPPPPGFCAGR